MEEKNGRDEVVCKACGYSADPWEGAAWRYCPICGERLKSAPVFDLPQFPSIRGRQ